MSFDFDRPTQLAGNHLSKWEGLAKFCGIDAPDAIPMWVADMNFRSPPCVLEALRADIEQGVLGYYGSSKSWIEAQSDWYRDRHGWNADHSWIVPVPGIKFALTALLQAFSKPGDYVAMFSPIYHEFAIRIRANDRRVHFQEMVEEQGRYRMDFDALERTMPDRTRFLLLCSPHNPGGRVWTKPELEEVAEFCLRRGLILISDEIHYDLVYEGHKHIPTAIAAPQIADRLLTLAGPTKSFNIAGAKTGSAIASSQDIRACVTDALDRAATGSPNRFGMIASEAAMRGGAPWLEAVLVYLQANRDHLHKRLATAVPGARPMPLDGTYLAWIDMSGTGLKREQFMERIAGRARIGVSPGPQFGPGGENHIRLNFAVQRAVLDEALDRLEEAFSNL